MDSEEAAIVNCCYLRFLATHVSSNVYTSLESTGKESGSLTQFPHINEHVITLKYLTGST